MVRVWGEFESAILAGVLTGERGWSVLADRIAKENNYTMDDIEWSKRAIERYMRTRGMVQMLPPEYRALLRIQSAWRRYAARKMLWKELGIMRRISVSDSVEHVSRAVALERVLNFA